MHVTLYGDAKKAQSSREGLYFLQTDPVNKKPCWFQENGGNAIWNDGDGWWIIGPKKGLGEDTCGIYSADDVEDPHQALTWNYSNSVNWIDYIESKDIFVSRTGII